MTTLSFGLWTPDTAPLNARDQNGAILMATAKNVYRDVGSYAPIPNLNVYQTGAGLPSPCVGSFLARTSTGGWVILAGTKTKLYKFNSGTSAWDDYTRIAGGDYNVPVGDYWSWCQFGSKVIAVNLGDNPQTIDVDTGATAFTDLAGTPPKARYVGIVNDFVILACLSTNPRSFMNSAWNSTTGWTIGTNLCDQQDLPDGHRITGFSGGEFGWLVQERALRRLIFQPGSDQAFRVERVDKERGAVGTYSVASVESDLYMYSLDGFYKYSASGGYIPIGHNTVNNWFLNNFDQNRLSSLLAFTDLTGPRIFWAGYQSGTSTFLDRVLIYDWYQNAFTYMDQTAAFWGPQATAAQTLEGLNAYGSIDYPSAGVGPGIPYSLDSPAFAGGIPLVSAIDVNGKLSFLNGVTPMTATLTTCPLQLQEGGRAVIRDVEPIGQWGDAVLALRISRREGTHKTLNYTSPYSPSTRTNVFRTKAAGRIHDIELTITDPDGSDAVWTHAQGLGIVATPDGEA